MQKTFKRNVHDGYQIGSDILIHGHLNDPESWFLSIKTFQIFAHRLCSKQSTEDEIEKIIISLLQEKEQLAQSLIMDIQNESLTNK